MSINLIELNHFLSAKCSWSQWRSLKFIFRTTKGFISLHLFGSRFGSRTEEPSSAETREPCWPAKTPPSSSPTQEKWRRWSSPSCRAPPLARTITYPGAVLPLTGNFVCSHVHLRSALPPPPDKTLSSHSITLQESWNRWMLKEEYRGTLSKHV